MNNPGWKQDTWLCEKKGECLLNSHWNNKLLQNNQQWLQ